MDGAFREQPREMLKSTTNSDFISNALRRIVREHWQTKISSDQKSIQILNDHASRMETLLGSFDYGAICMPNIILNSKKMNQRELVVYLSYIESLAIGYKLWLGDNDSANIFIAGLTLKARDTRSVSKYLDSFMGRMESKTSYYERRTYKENKNIEGLILELEKRNNGFFRFLRKGEINVLRRMINMHHKNSKKLSRRKDKYSGIMENIKSKKA